LTDDYSQRALTAAVECARSFGLRCDDQPTILRDAANLLLHLQPAPVVARVATTTALVRRPIEQWLKRDLDMAQYLVAQGFPAVPSSRELPPGPHLEDGFAITFSQFVDHDPNYIATADETAALLRDLHQALRMYPGKLDYLSPFHELPGWLHDAVKTDALSADDASMLRRVHAHIAEEIEALNLPVQPLHGDAHRKNLLKTPSGLLCTDFEDCCRGPIEWDIACYARAAAEGREAALAVLGPDMPPDRLAPFLAARDLQGTIWLPILATRFADRRALAAEWLAAARSRYGHL
jgi:Phosphotransferase enzyme family